MLLGGFITKRRGPSAERVFTYPGRLNFGAQKPGQNLGVFGGLKPPTGAPGNPGKKGPLRGVLPRGLWGGGRPNFFKKRRGDPLLRGRGKKKPELAPF